tara:strand:- start:514 stop:720 length:207 start_codon:yes stop_codon:yes gene_type:complete
MKTTKPENIPVYVGSSKNYIMKWYSKGMWHYRATIHRSNGILSGVFYTLENAEEYIQKHHEKGDSNAV